MAMDQKCVLCGKGDLIDDTYSDTFKYDDQEIVVDGLERSLCSVCGSDPIMPEQGRRNQLRVADAKRQHVGLLTSVQIRGIREFLNLSQQAAADLFGGGDNAFSKYERGDVIQSRVMDSALRLAKVCGEQVVLVTLGKPNQMLTAEYEQHLANLRSVGGSWIKLAKEATRQSVRVQSSDVHRTTMKAVRTSIKKVESAGGKKRWTLAPERAALS
jgi:putative zinc finger/helix-turn-helix YgiT family protein